MPRRSARRRSSRPAVLQDEASGLAHEVIRRRAGARRDPDVRPKQAAGDGHGSVIRDAADVEKWAHGRIAELEYEEAWVLVIDKQHRLLRAKRVGEGNAGKTHLEPEHVIAAVRGVPRAAGFILVHNHPSDIPKPGEADIDATKEVMQLANQRGLRFLDSVIVGRTSHSSLLDLGLMSKAKAPQRG